MRVALFAILFLFSLCKDAVFAQTDTTLSLFLNTKGFECASIGVSVKSVVSGNEVLAYNSNKSLKPASTLKIISTLFALDVCGPNYTYKTDVYKKGNLYNGFLNGSIIIKSDGDPTLDSKYFPGNKFMDNLIETLRLQGVKNVYDLDFQSDVKSPGLINGVWLSEDIANYYGAAWQPFNWRDNSCDLHLRTSANQAMLLYEYPSSKSIRYVNMVQVGPNAKSDIWVYGGPSGYREIRGTMPPRINDYIVKGAMGIPSEYFETEFVKKTQRPENVKIGDTPRNLDTVFIKSYTSPTFAEIIHIANKHSVNLFVEAVSITAANQLRSDENYASKIKIWLNQHTSGAKGVIIRDACGLSPLNAVSPDVFTDMLIWADGKWNNIFNESLPIAGEDGTLKTFTKETPALKGRVLAKTGTMSAVKSLAGYLTARSGERYAFSIIINNYICTTAEVNNAMAYLLLKLYENF